ncbi:MAG: LPS export ABC transporter periplasmic protein LptC [Gemmatimonadales bacterium]|nr:MAG: LPS export ABC transporter periplasmic protein LptC [Gemmatimonadales bacterium]
MSHSIVSASRNRRGPVFFLVLFLSLVAGCSSEDTVTTIPADYLAFDADGIVFGMVHRITQDGRVQGLVHADTAIQWQDSSAVHLRGVDLTVMEEDGSERAHVTSRTGMLDTRTNRMTAYGDVVMIIPASARRIESQELHYDPQGDQIWSDSAFVFTEGSRVRRGQAFRSDLEFRNFQIVGRGAARP